jgi:predicted dehydrogenase
VINAAIVGLGWWGRTLVEASRAPATRCASWRARRAASRRREAVRRQHKLEARRQLRRALLDDPKVDAVVLATPHSMHVEQVVAAAAAASTSSARSRSR